MINNDTLASIDANMSASKLGFDPRRFVDARARWYGQLLLQTLKRCVASVPYYAADTDFRSAVESVRSISDITSLPILRRDAVARDRLQFVDPSVPQNHVFSTSGTMGSQLVILGNSAENEALDSIFSVFRKGLGITPSIVDDGITLRLGLAPRRFKLHTQSPREINIAFTRAHTGEWYDQYDYLLEMLFDQYRINQRSQRIRALSFVPPYNLPVLTQAFLERGVDLRALGLTAIRTTGGPTTPEMRRMVKDDWGCTFASSFSCSEIRGSCWESADIPGLFVTQPPFISEILDPLSLQPVEVGETGLLVLTSLYPFQQVMPFIRYFVGDLAQRVSHYGDAPYVEAFYLLGRARDCVEVGEKHWLGTRDILNAVTGWKQIPQIPYPRFEIDGRHSERVTVRIEAIQMHETQDALVKNAITSAIVQEFERRCGVKWPPRELTIELCKKGSLINSARLYPDR